MRLSRGVLLVLVALLIVAAITRWWPRAPHRRDAAGGIRDLARTSPLNQPGGPAAPADAYEPYSALYAAPVDEPLVFSEDSVADIPQLNGSCLRPSTSEEHEMNDAFEAANRQSHRWAGRFEIPQGYRLVARAEAQVIQRCLDVQGEGSADCAGYKGVRHVRFLAVPGFDHTHTHALVEIFKMRRVNAGSGGIFVVKKSGGAWKRVEPTDFTRDCSWMY